MYHLDNTSGVPEMPEPKEQQSITPRWFGESQEQGGVSWPGADWFNIVQAELLNVLTAAGITPDKTAFDQLAKAISLLGDSKIRQDLNSANLPGTSLIKTDTGRDIGETLRGASGVSQAHFPLLMNKFTQYRHGVSGSQTQYRFYGFGSSVGKGATLPAPSIQAPIAKFYEYFQSTVNRTGIYPVSFTNKSVNGSTINNFLANQWPEVVAEGVYPDLALFIYGMNDFPTAQYNAGQTFNENGFKQRLRKAIRLIRDAGGDVVLTTSPHPYISNYSWSMPDGVSQVWPEFVAYPVPDESLDPPVSQSVTQFVWKGSLIKAGVRFLRGNDAIRQIALELGCVLIDVEKYWFDAVARYGEAALFNEGEFVHPNEFGHDQSYGLAFRDYFANMDGNGWIAPSANHYDVFDVGGTGLNPQPKKADIDLMANGIRDIAFILRDKFARALESVDQIGAAIKWSYTSQTPTTGSPGYSLQWYEHHSRTGGLYTTGDVIAIPIPNRLSMKLFIDVWTSVQTGWAQTIEIIAVNREGVVSFTILGAHDNTPGGNRLFTLASGSGVLNINVLQANSSVKYHICGFNS